MSVHYGIGQDVDDRKSFLEEVHLHKFCPSLFLAAKLANLFGHWTKEAAIFDLATYCLEESIIKLLFCSDEEGMFEELGSCWPLVLVLGEAGSDEVFHLW